MHSLISRVTGKYRRTLATLFCRKMVPIRLLSPIISFTFDDAPKSAFSTGGAILRSYGAKATFFVSLGLLNSETEVGAIASPEDLLFASKEGHELGCHTLDHLDAWQTTTDKFMESVIENGRVLDSILPGEKFSSFAYPKSGAKLSVKYLLQKHFICCRGGGQIPNIGIVDLNLLKACFLDRRTQIDIEYVKKLIDYNASQRGWLIFATHDVTDYPSPYGCTPKFFREVAEYSALSGALLLPVGEACEKLLASSSK